MSVRTQKSDGRLDLSIVIVSFNGADLLDQCLRSIDRETKGISFETIVVDNASTDRTRQLLQERWPGVQVVWNEINRGFAAANNIGLRQARGRFLLLLNPDTEVLDGALQKTLRFMEADPQVGVAGCRLLYADRSLQYSVRGFPTLWNVFCEASFLYHAFPATRRSGSYGFSRLDYSSSAAVDWVCGAMLMIRREVLDTVGFLDEQFYMYAEEVDYCFRVTRAGYRVWFFAGATVIHHWGGVSTPTRQSMLWSHGSDLLMYQKHSRGLVLAAKILMKYAGIAARTIVYAVAGTVGNNSQLKAKASNAVFALRHLPSPAWRYHRDPGAPVTPWPSV